MKDQKFPLRPASREEAGLFYAEAYMNQHGLSATDHGYVAWNGGEIYYEYSQLEQSNSPSLSM